MPERVKRTALTQQALTIMKNTSQELPEDLKTHLLSEFSRRMRASGYGARYRLEIIKSTMTAFDKMREEQEHSGRPINRPRSYQRETRKKKKMSVKSQWYKAGGYSTVMFVPATPHGKLANILRESERKMAQERGCRIKIVEKGGQKISSRLVKDPWTGPCDKDERLVCQSTETRSDRKNSGPCTRNGCCYRTLTRDHLSTKKLWESSRPTMLLENMHWVPWRERNNTRYVGHAQASIKTHSQGRSKKVYPSSQGKSTNVTQHCLTSCYTAKQNIYKASSPRPVRISWSVINQLLSNNCIFESYFWKQFLKTVYYY